MWIHCRTFCKDDGHGPIRAAALDAVVTQQAQIIAYIDDYKFLLILTIAVHPLLLFFRKGKDADAEHPMAAE